MDNLKINISQKSPERFSYEDIQYVYTLSKDFYSASPVVCDYLKRETINIGNIIHETIGHKYLGGFGLGYPFYVLKQDGSIAQIREIDDFINQQKDNVQNGKPLDQEWICPNCQVENDLPDLKSVCKSCNLTHVKPRDVLKTIPDIDYLTIVDDGFTDDELIQIQEGLKLNGYSQSDISIRNSLQETKMVLETLAQNKDTKHKLPIDLHVLRKEDFLQALNRITKGEEPIIQTDSLRSGWEKYDLPIWFDFLFSAQEVGYMDEDLKQAIAKTRRYIKDNFDIEELVEKLKNFSPRATRIFDSSDVAEILRDKFNSW